MKHRRARHHLLRVASLLALSLALGAICTLGVAWGIAVWTRPSDLPPSWGKMGVTADGRTFFVRGGSARGRAAASILSGKSESMLAAKERGARLRLGRRDVGPYEASAVLPHWTATYEAMRLGRMTPDLRRPMNIGLLASHDEERYSFIDL